MRSPKLILTRKWDRIVEEKNATCEIRPSLIGLFVVTFFIDKLSTGEMYFMFSCYIFSLFLGAR